MSFRHEVWGFLMILFLITLFGNFIMWREWNQWHPDFNVHFINREAQASTDEKNAVQQLSVSALPKAVDASRAELWPRDTLHTQSNTAGSEEPCWLNFCSPNHEMTEPAVNIKSSNQSWFQGESFCKSTCCAYPQLVDKGRSARKILTVQTLAELAELQSLLSPFSSQKVKLPLVSPKMLRCIQPGALIYVPTNLVSRHFSLIHPILPHPYVLLSGDTDASAEPFRYLQHLDSPKLLHWFGHNADFGNQTITHPKFSAVPLGVGKNSLFDPSVYINRVLAKRGIESPWTSSAINCVQQWKKQKHTVLLNKELGIERSVCPSQLFVSFNVKNHPSRAHLWDLLCMMHTPNVTCFYRMGTDVAYIMSMAREHLYGLSPRGIGRDCYRTWEYLYLGLVPIVEKLNGLRELFHDLPVIEIESWESIRSPHYLWVVIHDEFRKKFLKQPPPNFQNGWNKLFETYWRYRILHAARRLPSTSLKEGDKPDVSLLTSPEGYQYFRLWRYALV